MYSMSLTFFMLPQKPKTIYNIASDNDQINIGYFKNQQFENITLPAIQIISEKN